MAMRDLNRVNQGNAVRADVFLKQFPGMGNNFIEVYDKLSGENVSFDTKDAFRGYDDDSFKAKVAQIEEQGFAVLGSVSGEIRAISQRTGTFKGSSKPNPGINELSITLENSSLKNADGENALINVKMNGHSLSTINALAALTQANGPVMLRGSSQVAYKDRQGNEIKVAEGDNQPVNHYTNVHDVTAERVTIKNRNGEDVLGKDGKPLTEFPAIKGPGQETEVGQMVGKAYDATNAIRELYANSTVKEQKSEEFLEKIAGYQGQIIEVTQGLVAIVRQNLGMSVAQEQDYKDSLKGEGEAPKEASAQSAKAEFNPYDFDDDDDVGPTY